MAKSRAQVKREKRKAQRRENRCRDKVIEIMMRDAEARRGWDVQDSNGRRYQLRGSKVFIDGVEVGDAQITYSKAR